ncbi:unnamed protein product [Schistosoma intercalatum]|nr:unnamed protein product [Schistosoma intercalatum]
MIHRKSRRQYNGIIETNFIKNLHHLYIGHQIYINLTNIIDYYYYNYELSKLIMNRSITMNDLIQFNERVFLDVFKLIINENTINHTDYLHSIHRINNIDWNDDRNFIKKAYMKSLIPKRYIPGQSWYILLMHSWRLYFLFIIHSSNLWLRYKSENIINQSDLPKTIDEWSVIFIYLLCSIYHSKQLNRDDQLPYGFCPNPCLINPCLEVVNTKSSKCIRTGYFENSYKCECRNGYQWKQVKGYKGYCEAIDLCDKYCNKVGTRKCDVVQDRYFCVCRPTHMGLNCDYQRDPCVELASNVHMGGNMACNVANGGICRGTLGTNTYHCQCPGSFTSDPSYPFPNCLQIKDRCASTICIHGDCVSSKDGQESYCICPEGTYGKYCELTRGQWGQWSPWTECSPNCGLYNHRRRIRTRDCLGEACSGGLGYLHMEFCDTKPCSDEKLMLSRINLSEEIQKFKMLQVQGTRYVEISGEIAKYLLLITCIFSVTTVTAMIIVVYCL